MVKTFDMEKKLAIRSLYRFQWEAVQNNYVLLYPEGMIKLNHSAGEILSLCDGTRNAQEIIETLEHKFNEHHLSQDVISFLEDAHDRGWIN